MSLYGVINQKTGVIGELDIDDCAPTATIWAARDADHCSRRPTIPEFRKAAGNPDDPYRADGLTNAQLADAVPKIWPLADFMRVDTQSWTAFRGYLDRGDSISIAVNSAHLPSNLRFGFYANHRVGVRKVGGTIYMANPLAPNGSRPIAISESALRYAMSTLIRAAGWYLAISFRRQLVHLRFGARRTSRIPDRTRIASPSGAAWRYSSPTHPDDAHKVGSSPLPNGRLFVAYQRVTASGREFYGNHRGTQWVNADRLAHKGGST